MIRLRALGVGLAFAAAAGCAVGPGYEPPELMLPEEHRRAGTDRTVEPPAAAEPTPTIADLGFWELYPDPRLVGYLHEALVMNYDVSIAAARVLQAEAQARIAGSEFWPTVQAGGSWTTARSSQESPGAFPGADPTADFTDVFLAMPAYEVDLWGRIRRANEAARERLLATQDAERVVRQTIVAQVASAYFGLLALDEELRVSLETLASRNDSLELAMAREQGGVASLQDVRQSEVLVASAEAALVDVRRRLEVQENVLSILLGRNPGSIERSASVQREEMPAEVLAGMPSALLRARPDIQQAERLLVASNADVGQAQAAFYPAITLTGSFGTQSIALSDLFTSPARVWQFGPTVTMPLFTGGRLTAELELAEARFEESLATYRRTVQNAFREVSDALIAYQRTQEFAERQEATTIAYRDSSRLARLRYEGGVTSYLEVLLVEQDLFDSEIRLTRAWRDRALSLVELYRALGGGWQESPVPEADRNEPGPAAPAPASTTSR